MVCHIRIKHINATGYPSDIPNNPLMENIYSKAINANSVNDV